MPEQDKQETKQSNKDRLKDITDSIEKGIAELFQSDKYRQYLTTMSRFHKYSVNNQMLIYMQMPNATHVAGFNKWHDQFQRNVMKGQRGIKIIAPTPFKKKIEQEKLDPDTRLPVLDADGKPIIEEKEIKIPMFKPVTVFDVSQTEGKPLPQLASDLHGNVQNYEAFMEALKRSAPVPITLEPMVTNMDGYFDTEHKSIHVREGMSEVQTVSATVHEIAHSKLHDPDRTEMKPQWKVVAVSEGGTKHDFSLAHETEESAMAFAEENEWRFVDENQFEWRLEVEEDMTPVKIAAKNRNTEEVEAESISFAVCAYYGISTGENSFGYIASWSQGKELKVLKASLETINKTSAGLIEDIDRNYAEIMKERGMDELTQDAQKEAIFLLDDSQYLHVQSSEAGAWDYSLYDKNSMKLIDGGQLDSPDLPLTSARDEILKLHELAPETITAVAEDKISDIAEAFGAANSVLPDGLKYETVPVASYPAEENNLPFEVVVEKLRIPESEPAAPVPADAPDPAISFESMNAFGYTDADMLPLTKDRALELSERDVAVYLLYGDNTEAMALDDREIIEHDGLFGVTREDWDAVKADIPIRDIETRFTQSPEDGILIYQLKRDAPATLLFTGYDSLPEPPSAENYKAVYLQPLYDGGSKGEVLEKAYRQFNIQRPADFTGHSMSVSDIVAIKRGPDVSYHYCDSIGFKEVAAFKPENYLKAAEIALEDDYNMIDGVVNNGPKQEPEKKPSVLEKLRQPTAERKPKTTAPKKSAEMEM